METRVSILFYAKKTRKTKKIDAKELIIYLRATIDGKRFEVSANRSVDPDKWSSAAGRMKGNSEQVRSIKSAPIGKASHRPRRRVTRASRRGLCPRVVR